MADVQTKLLCHCSNTSSIIIPYFSDETSYQTVTAGLVRFIRENHPGASIDLIDLSLFSHNGSHRKVAKIFGLNSPLDDLVRELDGVEWQLPQPTRRKLKFDEKIDAALLSDLISLFPNGKRPRSLLAKSMRRRLSIWANKIFQSTLGLTQGKHYCIAYVLNGRGSGHASFLQAIDQSATLVMYWENSASPKDIVLFEHPIHDFYALRNAVTEIELSDDLREKAVDWFEERFRAGGDPRYGQRWKRALNKREITDSGQRTQALFVTSSTDEFMSLGHMSPKRLWEDQYDAVEKLASLLVKQDLGFTIRMHPNSLNKPLIYVLVEAKRILKLGKTVPEANIVWPQDSESTYGLIKKSNLIFSVGSTASIEAMYLGKKVFFLDHSIFFYSSSKALLTNLKEDISAEIQQIGDQREHAIREIAYQLANTHSPVKHEDKVAGWTRLHSLIAFRDPIRLMNALLQLPRRLCAIGIFALAKYLS